MKRFFPRKRRATARLSSVPLPRPRPLSVSLSRFGSAFAMLGALAAGVSGARAATITWDANPGLLGIQDGAGTWTTNTINPPPFLWTADGGLTQTPFTTGDDV